MDLESIDADTSYRLTRNILRVLLINVLEAWTRHDPALMQRTALVIERVRHHCHRSLFDQQSAQENHRGFADAVLERVQCLEHAQEQSDLSGAAEEALPTLMLLMLRSERELANEAIRQEHLKNVLPLFSPYLAGVPF